VRQSPVMLYRLAAALRGIGSRMDFRLLAIVVLYVPLSAQAQLYSYDGNRWYEMEVLIFRHIGGENRVTERAAPLPTADTAEVATAPDVPRRELLSPLRDFLIDFDALPINDMDLAIAPAAPYGPSPQDSGAGSFRLMDFSRDPWIALTDASRQLARDAQRLKDSGSHELLWHRVWRQPMLGAAQAPAVEISTEVDEMMGAGESVQGSIRFTSFNQTTLRVALALALAPTADALSNQNPFAVRPVPVVTRSGWTLAEQRDILPNTYHYFDTPAFGVLLQVRPYELPALAGSLPESDF